MPNNISAFSKITKLWMHVEDHLLEWKKNWEFSTLEKVILTWFYLKPMTGSFNKFVWKIYANSHISNCYIFSCQLMKWLQ